MCNYLTEQDITVQSEAALLPPADPSQAPESQYLVCNHSLREAKARPCLSSTQKPAGGDTEGARKVSEYRVALRSNPTCTFTVCSQTNHRTL